MKTLVFASHNQGKIQEVRAILNGQFEVLSLSDLSCDIDPKETGRTFFANALIKAQTIFEATGIPALADDSGLAVTALNGAPGVYSARFSEEGTDQANNEKLLTVLKNTANRRAKFVTVLVYYDGDRIRSSQGEVAGEILFSPRGENGFGYDPLFYCTQLKKTFAEATAAEKNAVSHRAAALRSIGKML